MTQRQLRDHVNGVSDDVLRLFRVLGSTLYDFSIQGAVGSAQFPGACQARTLLNSETVKDEKALTGLTLFQSLFLEPVFQLELPPFPAASKTYSILPPKMGPTELSKRSSSATALSQR